MKVKTGFENVEMSDEKLAFLAGVVYGRLPQVNFPFIDKLNGIEYATPPTISEAEKEKIIEYLINNGYLKEIEGQQTYIVTIDETTFSLK